ncbi:MAG: hypothetical protein ACRBFS_15380 [Aureispira sp.]
MEEIIIGSVIGTLISILSWVWITKKNIQQQAVIEEEALEEGLKEKRLPLEKKLRDAIYEEERQLKKCEQEINEACQQLLDLIQDVGKKSHMEVAGKPLFFAYYNPISKEKYFYYSRDLQKDLSPEVLEQTGQLAKQYQQHIDLLCTQQEIFKQLLTSHQENLARLAGIQEQEGQWNKINNHQEKLAQLKGEQQLEEQAIYSQLLLEGIAEELEHQEECMRQYIDLSNTYQRPLDQVLDENYQQELQHLLTQLELEDPSQLD